MILRALAVLCLLASVARADPLALRVPSEQRGIAAAVGYPHASLAFRFDNGLAVAVSTRFPVTVVSADVGYRRLIVGDEDGWSCAAAAWTGLSATLLSPALALDLGLGIHARLRHEWLVVQVGAVTPMQLRLTGGFLARIPVAMDVWLGAQLSRVTFGVQGSAGATFVNDEYPTPYLQGSVFAAVAL